MAKAAHWQGHHQLLPNCKPGRLCTSLEPQESDIYNAQTEAFRFEARIRVLHAITLAPLCLFHLSQRSSEDHGWFGEVASKGVGVECMKLLALLDVRGCELPGH